MVSPCFGHPDSTERVLAGHLVDLAYSLFGEGSYNGLMSAPLFLLLLFMALGTVGAAYVLAKRVGAIVPFVFIVTYVLTVGAILFVNIGVFHIVDPKFRETWLEAWLEIYWPLWAVFFAPSAMLALLACRYARSLMPRDAAKLLGSYLVFILVAIEIAWVLDAQLLLLAGEFVGLSAIFLTTAYWKRTASGVQLNSSVLPGKSAQ